MKKIMYMGDKMMLVVEDFAGGWIRQWSCCYYREVSQIVGLTDSNNKLSFLKAGIELEVVDKEVAYLVSYLVSFV